MTDASIRLDRHPKFGRLLLLARRKMLHQREEGLERCYEVFHFVVNTKIKQ